MKKSLITLLILSLAAFAAVSAYAQDDAPQDGTDQTAPDSPPNDEQPQTETPDEQPPAENPDEPQPSDADPVETGITPPISKRMHVEPNDFIIKAGVESMSRSDYISGGSFLYTEFAGMLTDGVFMSAKISSSVVPTEQDTCLFGGMTFNALDYGEYAAYISPFYMTNLTPEKKGRNHHVGGKFCLFAQNDPTERVYIEFLPISFLYDTRTKDISYGFEFVTLGIRF